MILVLYEPQLASNVGNIVRTCVCFQTPLYIIKPIGFIWDLKKIKHSALDYFKEAEITFFNSFEEFENKAKNEGRIFVTNCVNGQNYKETKFEKTDHIVMGNESFGLPAEILQKHNAITIPILKRSLNLSIASAIFVSHICTN